MMFSLCDDKPQLIWQIPVWIKMRIQEPLRRGIFYTRCLESGTDGPITSSNCASLHDLRSELTSVGMYICMDV
jgi:hypothetical protein